MTLHFSGLSSIDHVSHHLILIISDCIRSSSYQGGNRKELITEKTWASVEERSRIRANLLDSKSERIRELIQKEYDAMNKIAKKNA